MKQIETRCPSCGAKVVLDDEKKTGFCRYCKSEVSFEHLFPKKKPELVSQKKKLSPKAYTATILVAVVFAAIIVLLVLQGIGTPDTDSKIFKTAGVYLTGTDIPAGEYVMYPSSNKEADFEVRRTKEPTNNSYDLLYKKTFYVRQFVVLNDGEYIDFKDANLYKIESMRIKAPDENGFSPAQFKVGTDILAGEYLLVKPEAQLFYMITTTPQAGTDNLNSPDVKDVLNGEYRMFINVKEGEYLYFTTGRLYKADLAPKIIMNADGSYPSGQYKINTELALGKYLFRPMGASTHRYSIIKNNPLYYYASFDKDNIIFDSDYFYEDTIISLPSPSYKDIYYFNLIGATLLQLP